MRSPPANLTVRDAELPDVGRARARACGARLMRRIAERELVVGLKNVAGHLVRLEQYFSQAYGLFF